MVQFCDCEKKRREVGKEGGSKRATPAVEDVDSAIVKPAVTEWGFDG